MFFFCVSLIVRFCVVYSACNFAKTFQTQSTPTAFIFCFYFVFIIKLQLYAKCSLFSLTTPVIFINIIHNNKLFNCTLFLVVFCYFVILSLLLLLVNFLLCCFFLLGRCGALNSFIDVTCSFLISFLYKFNSLLLWLLLQCRLLNIFKFHILIDYGNFMWNFENQRTIKYLKIAKVKWSDCNQHRVAFYVNYILKCQTTNRKSVFSFYFALDTVAAFNLFDVWKKLNC